MKIFRVFLMLALSTCTASASVPLGGNRKGADGSYDMYGCMLSNDYYVVNFAAYQFDPTQTKDAKNIPQAECVDLPGIGKTQISIDLLDMDIRKKPVALKIISEEGKTLAELPMSVVKQGVLSTTVDFKAPGKYQAILTVEDSDLRMPLEVTALHMPLTVALVAEVSGTGDGLLILLGAIGVIVSLSAYYLPRQLKPKPVENI
ncbi:MAG: hypothetical protein CTY19_01865 [Methylomonas sp.]|nr:MAG: hypothetical protein CTY19_01865 [Methylomonas sp.]